METDLHIDVATLDDRQRRMVEEVIGRKLTDNQRLIIRVTESEAPAADSRPAQTLADWMNIYEGLSDAEIDEIDKVVNTRANLTRNLHLP